MAGQDSRRTLDSGVRHCHRTVPYEQTVFRAEAQALAYLVTKTEEWVDVDKLKPTWKSSSVR